MSVTFLTDKDLDNLLLKSGTLIESAMNSNVVSINDAANRPAILAMSEIKANQPGVGNPGLDNVRPISGWNTVNLFQTQKNMLGFENFSFTASTGAYTDTYTDGVFHREVSQYVTTTYAVITNGIQYIKHPHIPAGTYTFSITYTSNKVYNGVYLQVTLSDGTIVQLPNGVTTTIEQGGTITGVRMSSQGFTAGSVIEFTMQLEVGPGTSYKPYRGTTMTAALPETVYGGSLDWTTGMLTVTHALLTLTGSGFTQNSSKPWLYVKPVSDLERGEASSKLVVCSHFYSTTRIWTAEEMGILTNTNYIHIGYPAAATVADFHAFLTAQAEAGTPVQVVYKIATPYNIQLDPQQLDLLKGSNTIWSDTGNTLITYPVDTKLYIDNKFDALQNAILASGANI